MAVITLMKTPAETNLSQAFEAAKSRLPGDRAAREQAFELFAERGLPHRRIEDFKYTDLRALLREAAPPAERPAAADARAAVAGAAALRGIAAVEIAIVNGHLIREASSLDRLPEGIEIRSLAEAMASGDPLLKEISPVASARDNPIYQLNSAFMADGAVVRITERAAGELLVHLRFVSTGASAVSTATRTLLIVEDRASVTLLESHEGPDGVGFQLNDVVEMVVGNGASVRHVRLNAGGSETFALSTLAAKLGSDVSFDTLNMVLGASVARHQVYLLFEGERSSARVNGAAMLRGRQHSDATLVVDHASPHCGSRELFKTVIDDDATGVFQGKIIVRPRAQKTDGRMMSAALLLSDAASMNNKPELEIFADDVQCGHGATSGQIDEDLLFYLMARGLRRPEAESLLIQAFLGEAVELVEHEAVREALVALIEGRLRERA